VGARDFALAHGVQTGSGTLSAYLNIYGTPLLPVSFASRVREFIKFEEGHRQS